MSGHFVSRGFVGNRRSAGVANRVPPGQYVTTDFPVLSAGPTPRTPLDQLDASRSTGSCASRVSWTWAGVHATSLARLRGRHPLRHQVDQARHALARRQRRHSARAGRARPQGRCPHRLQRRRLHHQHAHRRRPQRPGLRRLRLRRQAPGSRARRPRPPGRAPPVFLEERQVGRAACASWRRTSPASGSRSATTTTATPGKKSATRATERRSRHWSGKSPRQSPP